MSRYFVNLNSDAALLPATLSVPVKGKLYFGRVLHAERDHCLPSIPRLPEPYRHQHFHIVLVTAGSGMFHLDGVDVPVRDHDIVFTSPPVRHYFDNVGSSRVRYAELTFDFLTRSGKTLDISFDALLAAWTKQPCRKVLRARAPRSFAKLLMLSIDALVSREKHVRPAGDLELNAILASVLTASFEGFFRVRDRLENDDGNALDPVRDFIRAHYSEELSLAKLSRLAGMTPNYFSRRFKQFFGRTPIDYQLDLRIRHACVLLKTADRKLSDVAAAVGFDDVYYFSRLFSRRVGVAPGRYRREGT